MIQITRKFRLRIEKCFGFGQFDQRIRSDYAIIRITLNLLCKRRLSPLFTFLTAANAGPNLLCVTIWREIQVGSLLMTLDLPYLWSSSRMLA